MIKFAKKIDENNVNLENVEFREILLQDIVIIVHSSGKLFSSFKAS